MTDDRDIEDQIRRLGDDRADRVGSADWRDGRSGPPWGRIAAIAAIAVVVVGGVVGVALAIGDDDATDTATTPETVPSNPVTTSEPSSSAPTTTETPTTTGAPATTTLAPVDAACGPGTGPTHDQLDIAVHLGPDRTPLDLDQDGAPDELVVWDDADGRWWMAARLRRGWTPPLDLDADYQPGLASTPDGTAAGHDLDGDGQLEFFFTGDILDTARLVSLQGCMLARPGDVGVAIGIPAEGGICAEFCFTRVFCDEGVLTTEIYHAPTPDQPTPEWAWTVSKLTMTMTEAPTAGETEADVEFSEGPVRLGPLDVPPPDAPTADTTGVVDCSP